MGMAGAVAAAVTDVVRIGAMVGAAGRAIE
jgi:hypothetical protein